MPTNLRQKSERFLRTTRTNKARGRKLPLIAIGGPGAPSLCTNDGRKVCAIFHIDFYGVWWYNIYVVKGSERKLIKSSFEKIEEGNQ
jgi:hypothetical protein